MFFCCFFFIMTCFLTQRQIIDCIYVFHQWTTDFHLYLYMFSLILIPFVPFWTSRLFYLNQCDVCLICSSLVKTQLWHQIFLLPSLFSIVTSWKKVMTSSRKITSFRISLNLSTYCLKSLEKQIPTPNLVQYDISPLSTNKCLIFKTFGDPLVLNLIIQLSLEIWYHTQCSGRIYIYQ